MGAEFNFAVMAEAVAAVGPDRLATVQGDRRLSFRELVDRARRLARLLSDHGLGCHAERTSQAGHEIGQHRMAQYLYNGPEYLEGMLGAYRARVAPFNVNYRYVAAELRYLLEDAEPSATVLQLGDHELDVPRGTAWTARRGSVTNLTRPPQAIAGRLSRLDRQGLASILLRTHTTRRREQRRLSRKKLDDGELLGFLFLMIMAGMDTTWSVIGAVVYHLAAYPEHARYLREDLTRVPVAVEEMLRLYAPAVLGRQVTRDGELNGSALYEGDTLLVCYPSANRDEKAFDRPDEAVLDRYPNRHIAFGSGVHRCLGASLARMELKVAIEEWLVRLPECALEDPAAVRWSAGPVRGPKRLPIRFPPGAREAR